VHEAGSVQQLQPTVNIDDLVDSLRNIFDDRLLRIGGQGIQCQQPNQEKQRKRVAGTSTHPGLVASHLITCDNKRQEPC
jgi:hypothetical protein